MLRRQYIVWRVDSHHCLASLDPTLQSELPTSWCTYTHNTHPVASAHVKESPDCPMCPEPGWENQKWWDPHNRHGANRQGNKGETQCAKAVSHVALDEVEPLISLSWCEGRVLVLTYVHNWLLLLSTHDASSVGVHNVPAAKWSTYTPEAKTVSVYTQTVVNHEWIRMKFMVEHVRSNV